MKDFSLYVILDRQACLESDLVKAAEQLIAGGADIIQLRDKTSDDKTFFSLGQKIQKVTQKYGIPLIINDRLDLTLAINADGVHLGQDDLPIAVARELLGKNKIIGCSTHSLEQALRAQEEGADYIGVGPIFSTPTKPNYKAVGLDLIRQINGKVKIPFVAIGGIDNTNISEILSSGAKIIAVVRSAVAQKDITAAVKNLKNIILGYKRKYDLIRIS